MTLRSVRSRMVVAACVISAAFMCSSCGPAAGNADNTADQSAEPSQKGAVVVIVKSQQSPDYWNIVNKGALDAGEEEGRRIILKAPPTEGDIDIQDQMVMDAAAQKAAAIVLAPTNTEALNDSIQNAMDSGIPVITIDARCSLDDVVYIGTDNRSAGFVAGKQAKALLIGSKKVAVVALAEGSAVSDDRLAGFSEALGSSADIVETTFCGSDRGTAKSQTVELVKKYPELEMIFAVNQTSTLGVCDAISDMGLSESVTVIGFDSSKAELDYLGKGVLDGFVVQNPYNMGYLGVRNAVKMINGESVPQIVDTGTTFVNRENLMEADVQLLIDPLG